MLPALNSKQTTDTNLAISLEDVARQCYISSDELTDPEIVSSLTTAIYSAQSYLESNYAVSFGCNEFKAFYFNDSISADRYLHLPIAEVESIQSIKINGKESKDSFELFKSNTHSLLISNITSEFKNITVEYKAGFTTTPDNVKQALLLLSNYYFEQRNPEGKESLKNPIDALMLPYKKIL